MVAENSLADLRFSYITTKFKYHSMKVQIVYVFQNISPTIFTFSLASQSETNLHSTRSGSIVTKVMSGWFDVRPNFFFGVLAGLTCLRKLAQPLLYKSKDVCMIFRGRNTRRYTKSGHDP